MAIFDHTMQFKLLTLSQHYNYSRQRVSGITVKVSMFSWFIFPKQVRKFITHYSLLITHYSLLGIQTPFLYQPISVLKRLFANPICAIIILSL